MKIDCINLHKNYSTFYGAYVGKSYKQRYPYYFDKTIELINDIKREV